MPQDTKGKVVIGIDPGPTQPGTTGVAVRQYVNGKKVYLTAPYSNKFDVYKLFDHHLGIGAVVIERFATSGRISRHGLGTVELVGSVEALCVSRGIPFYRQQPFERKAFIAQAKVILQGKPYVVHEMDALAHLLRWERKHEPTDT